MHSCVELVPIFNHLNHQQMDEILDMSIHRKFKKNEVLFMPGDKADTLYIVASGEIHLSTINENGRELLIQILKPGDFIGELALMSVTDHELLATAKKDSEMCTIKFDDFQNLLIKYPAVSIHLLQELSERLTKRNQQSMINSTLSVQERVAKYLMEHDGQLLMSKKDLASYLSTTPESISRILTQFEDEGYIEKVSSKKLKILQDLSWISE